MSGPLSIRRISAQGKFAVMYLSWVEPTITAIRLSATSARLEKRGACPAKDGSLTAAAIPPL